MSERGFDVTAANREEALDKAIVWVTRMNKITEATYLVIDVVDKEDKYSIAVSQH